MTFEDRLAKLGIDLLAKNERRLTSMVGSDNLRYTKLALNNGSGATRRSVLER